MGLIDNWRMRVTAMRIGLSIMGEGLGFKGPGKKGFLSAIATMLQPRWGEPPKRGTREWLQLYGQNPRLRSVYKIAKDVAAAPWGLYVNRGKEKQEILDHPMITLLNKPNPKMTGYTLMYLLEVWLQMCGEGGWLIERNGLRTPGELWPIPPHWVIDTPSVAKPYFTVQPQNTVGVILHIAPEDMVWFKESDPADPFARGIGSAAGILDEVETDEYMSKWAKRFFFNDAKPPIVIQAPGADKNTSDRLKEEWMERYSGYNNAHKPAILPWDAKIQQLGNAQREMDFVESRRFLRDTANQHNFMPPELMGIVENSNRATIDAADYLYTKNVLKPNLNLIQDQIQLQLCPEFDEKLLFEFANPVPEDKEFKLKVSNEGLSRGAMEVDEWRQANGYDPLPKKRGKVLYVPISVIPTDDPGGMELNEPTEGKPPNEPLPGEDKSPEKRVKTFTAEQKTAFWWKFEKAAKSQEANLERAMKRYFQAQQDKVVKKLEAVLGEKTVKENSEDDIERIVSEVDEQKKLSDTLKSFWVEGARQGNVIAAEALGEGIAFDLILPEMLEWIKTDGAELVKGINNTTKEGLRETLAEGIQEGESIPKLRDRVSEIMNIAKSTRATTIARTETHGSVTRGTFKSYDKAGVEQKEWLATRDTRTRDSHRHIDGERKALDEPFSNGLQHPGGAGPASEVVNCRCALLPVIEDDE